ncbi:MAG: apolipoprotein N-acyltransferase [Rhodocyclaceae bacterium]|nr:apolipoprotein N-acyltransferase [Rhodocyclaceae bacterium]
MMRGLLVALALGAATVLGFAPFGLFPIPFLTLALLVRQWAGATSAWRAALLGMAWGLGFFLAGVSWVYVSLHEFGAMPAPLAALATLLFCAYLALFPALAGGLFRRWHEGSGQCVVRDALLAASVWTLAEWLRGSLFTGFPWLALGYSQAPPSPLAGFAPLIGSLGLGFLVFFIAALLASGWRRSVALAPLLALLVIGFGLRGAAWTEPVGEPLKVSLLQGNIPQDLKWNPERLPLSLETYQTLALAAPAPLTVLPETAIPLFFDDIPRDLLHTLTTHGEALMGVAVRTREGGYTNGAVAIGRDLSVQAYSKRHLVPFGEFIPPGFGWFFGLVRIPMSDFTAGPAVQKPLLVAGQKVATSICYEDLFGEEVLAFLPEATLLVNLSNTAWFGDSLAQPQHLQIAQLRALETGRPMLRATNTGMTAAIAPNGRVTAALDPFTSMALQVEVRGFQGRTPYSLSGDRPLLLLCVLIVIWITRRRRKAAKPS